MLVAIDPTTFDRFAEIRKYADRRGIGYAQAVEELVNCGLSHIDQGD